MGVILEGTLNLPNPGVLIKPHRRSRLMGQTATGGTANNTRRNSNTHLNILMAETMVLRMAPQSLTIPTHPILPHTRPLVGQCSNTPKAATVETIAVVASGEAVFLEGEVIEQVSKIHTGVRGIKAPQEGDGGDGNPDAMDVEANPFRPPKNLQVEDADNEGRAEDAMSPPSRQPPSGPGAQSQPGSAGKFSFAFKPSSKPTPAAPKPEISQKFNAAPQRREPPKETRDRDREPPRSAPTEPASARSRHDFRNPPDGPRVTPRMRKVKKIMRRPKPRPTLPSDLVDSESVFFRKPGNESVVGSGTYGKVFKGLNVYTKGLVALKRIRMEGERDGFPVTAVREIKLLQSLRHINIVNLQEVMVEKNDCFMVFEYMSHDLTGLLNHPSFTLDAAQKKHLAKQLFEGLDYLHTRGVLHRDIKAANILVSNDGILKLADFGLARFYAKRHQLDYTNRVITIWYRSPELLLGETKYTAAVDVWSAACVMVEIFTRTAIFTGDGTELGQLEKIYNILGTPNTHEWPGLVDMAWFELLRPTAKRRNVFAAKYKERVTPAAFELLVAMFHYDPVKRPNAAEVLQHPYFATEEPAPRQAIELAEIDGDWHEFESKALRKENERRDREARRAAKDTSAARDKEKDKKRANEGNDVQRDAKRVQVDKNQKLKPTVAEA
ncbi:serine/threonine protein kinase, CMGC, CDC2/CDK subfamily [Neonectria punicea]|uniref:cyclin-dependent kinase n=1 Tax=Neonectria punicea TaxID=979145 RepID=A0ABR1GVM3_9HYPO